MERIVARIPFTINIYRAVPRAIQSTSGLRNSATSGKNRQSPPSVA